METKELKRIEVETPFGTLVAEPSGGDPMYPGIYGIYIYLLRKEKAADYPDRFIGGNFDIGKDGRIEQQLALVEAVMEDIQNINARTDTGTLYARVWDDPEDDDPQHTLVFESKPLHFDIHAIKKGDFFMTADGKYHVAGEDAHYIEEARFEDELVVYDGEGNSYFESDFDQKRLLAMKPIHDAKECAKPNLVIRPLSDTDIKALNTNCGPGVGDQTAIERQVVQYTDKNGNTGYLYVENELIEELGYDYIASHCSLTYSAAFNNWYCHLTQDDFRNDPHRCPPKTVDVRFVEEKAGENTEVWQNVETGHYYLRFLCGEPFAKWMTCGDRQSGWQDRATIRPNITFRHGTQEETVRYKDWNGSGAYSDTFNPNFRIG